MSARSPGLTSLKEHSLSVSHLYVIIALVPHPRLAGDGWAAGLVGGSIPAARRAPNSPLLTVTTRFPFTAIFPVLTEMGPLFMLLPFVVFAFIRGGGEGGGGALLGCGSVRDPRGSRTKKA